MGLLDGLAKAGLYGATGYLTGQNKGAEMARKNALAAEQQKREATQDALRNALLQAQKEAEDALALRRRTPDAPTIRNIDPLSPAGITASAQRADAVAKAQARYRAPGTSSAAPARTAEQEEAEGLAILNTPMPTEATRLLSAAFRAIRQRNPSMTPGRVTVRAYNGVKKARPDLFKGSAGGDAGFGFSGGATPQTVPTTTPSPVPAGAPGPSAIDPAVLSEARALIQGSANPADDLRASGFSDEQIKAILGG